MKKCRERAAVRTSTELRMELLIKVKVEVIAVLVSSPSLIILMVSVDAR